MPIWLPGEGDGDGGRESGMPTVRKRDRLQVSQSEALRRELSSLDEKLNMLDDTDPARTLLLANREEVEEELAELGLNEDGVRHIT